MIYLYNLIAMCNPYVKYAGYRFVEIVTIIYVKVLVALIVILALVKFVLAWNHMKKHWNNALNKELSND